MKLLERARRLLGRSRPRSNDEKVQLRAELGPSLWTADRATVDGRELTVAGWVIPPGDDWTRVGFALNGRAFTEVDLGRERPDLPPRFWFVDGVDRAGFEATITLTDEELSGAVPIEFDAVDRTTLVPFRPWQQQACCLRRLDPFPLPDGPRMRRVHGAPDEESYRLVGYSNYRTLYHALQHATGRGFESYERILDWGCGSGRMLRYFANHPGAGHPGTLTGADIDNDNLNWCREHLPFASYVHLPLRPPSSLPESSFDLVLGVSIFTHLPEALQFEWLAELVRVSAPGAILLMSVHGPTIDAMSGSVEHGQIVRRLGIIDGPSHDLDDILEDTSYYRTAHHSHEYIRREWSRYFDIVDILPACIGNVQDLVILRSRGASA